MTSITGPSGDGKDTPILLGPLERAKPSDKTLGDGKETPTVGSHRKN
jgi:hypothetical protein